MEPMVIVTLIAATAALLRSVFRAPPTREIIYVPIAQLEPEQPGVGCLTVMVVFVVILAVVRVLAI